MGQREQQLLVDIRKLQSEVATLTDQLESSDSEARSATETVKALRSQVAALTEENQRSKGKLEKLEARTPATVQVEKVVYQPCQKTTSRVFELEATVSLLERELAARDAG